MDIYFRRLFQNQTFLIVWCTVAAFGTYFCMYAFRKPFNSGLYQNYAIWGIDYKSILIITQVLGYMFSKFLGIKIISELKNNQRILLIISLILISEIALVLFGIISYPYNFIFMFLNGLPLGMVWGVIFSFLEGRRITEFIAVGLSINLVVGSGVLKTIYLTIKELTNVSEFLMPAYIGFIFLPIFILFVWMLSKIPSPDVKDLQTRSKRNPMSKQEKKDVLKEYRLGLLAIVFIYTILTTIRDFRDNFLIEIWQELNTGFDKNTFAQTEIIVGIVVLGLLVSVGFIKENRVAFRYIHTLILTGILACGGSTWLFQKHLILPSDWMILLGISFFLPYLLIQTLYFERFIALFKLKANAGFFVYICDSMGYLGSVFLLFYREFFMKDISWLSILINLSYLVCGVSLTLWVLIVLFFSIKNSKRSKLEINTTS